MNLSPKEYSVHAYAISHDAFKLLLEKLPYDILQPTQPIPGTIWYFIDKQDFFARPKTEFTLALKMFPRNVSRGEVLFFHEIQLNTFPNHWGQESIYDKPVTHQWPHPELHEPAEPSPPRRPPSIIPSYPGYFSHPLLAVLLEAGKGFFYFGRRRLGVLFVEGV